MTNDTLRLPSTHLALRKIGPWLSQLLDWRPANGASHNGKIELAIHELATNSVDHAQSSELELIATLGDKSLTVVMTDSGLPFDGRGRTAPTEPQVRGYGLMIIEQVAESIEYRRDDHLNVWTLKFSLEN